MYCNPIKPINLSLQMDSKDMYTALLDSFHARRVETIAGHQFAVINIGLRNGEATADLQQIHVTELAPWTGKGLPPFGTELEAGFACEDFRIWHRGICVAVGESPEGREEFCVVKFGNILAMYTEEGNRMRPIRTPAQIAAEEREKAIDDMWSVYWQPDVPTAKAALGLLWDAGYRKVEVKP